MSFGDDLRARRHALGLTQSQLAEALGVTFLTVSRWERGGRTPHALMIKGIEVVLDSLEQSIESGAKEASLEKEEGP